MALLGDGKSAILMEIGAVVAKQTLPGRGAWRGILGEALIDHLAQGHFKGHSAGSRQADVPGFVLAQLADAALGGGLGQWLFASRE